MLHVLSCHVKVGNLHMDAGDFPGKEARPSVVRLLDCVGHKFTMVRQCVAVQGVTTTVPQVAGCREIFIDTC